MFVSFFLTLLLSLDSSWASETDSKVYQNCTPDPDFYLDYTPDPDSQVAPSELKKDLMFTHLTLFTHLTWSNLTSPGIILPAQMKAATLMSRRVLANMVDVNSQSGKKSSERSLNLSFFLASDWPLMRLCDSPLWLWCLVLTCCCHIEDGICVVVWNHVSCVKTEFDGCRSLLFRFNLRINILSALKYRWQSENSNTNTTAKNKNKKHMWGINSVNTTAEKQAQNALNPLHHTV